MLYSLAASASTAAEQALHYSQQAALAYSLAGAVDPGTAASSTTAAEQAAATCVDVLSRGELAEQRSHIELCVNTAVAEKVNAKKALEKARELLEGGCEFVCVYNKINQITL